jgi:hypothetical protein
MIEWQFITVHWDRIEETKKKVPMLRDIEKWIPRLWSDVVTKWTYGGVFMAGALLGFRYNFI